MLLNLSPQPAIEDFRKVLKINNNNMRARQKYGLALYKMKNYDEALENLLICANE